MAKKKKEETAFDKLSPLHKNFVVAYLENMNAVKAYRIAYPKVTESTCRVNGCRLMKTPKIQAALKEHYDKIWADREEYTGQTLKQLMNIINFDISDYVDDNGNIDLTKLKELNSYPIIEISKKTNETKYGTNVQESVKTADKLRAISEMNKILGMFQEKVEHTGTIEIIPAERPKE